jgi:hypothetical protein
MTATREWSRCASETGLSDSEIALIVRGTVMGGQSGKFSVIAVEARCALEAAHEGLCADYVAELDETPGLAWLRWSRNLRAIDWLAACMEPLCLLFRGHPGRCTPFSRESDACARCHDLPAAGRTCPECGMTGTDE